MCNKQKVYRATLSSANNLATNDHDARYIIKLPHRINSGYMHVESFAILGGGTLLTGITMVRVCSSSFQQKGHFYSGGNSQNIIDEIPILSNFTNTADDFMYKKQVNSNSIGLPLESFDLNNLVVDLRLTDQTGTLLDEAQLASYAITLLFVDNDPDFKEY